MVDADRNQAHGGKTVYGASVGILMLETRFPRIPGDIGHAATWPFPVLYKVVRGATGERATTARANDPSTGLLDAFLAAGAELVQDGADGITTMWVSVDLSMRTGGPLQRPGRRISADADPVRRTPVAASKMGRRLDFLGSAARP
jgi:hypothetical protein